MRLSLLSQTYCEQFPGRMHSQLFFLYAFCSIIYVSVNCIYLVFAAVFSDTERMSDMRIFAVSSLILEADLWTHHKKTTVYKKWCSVPNYSTSASRYTSQSSKCMYTKITPNWGPSFARSREIHFWAALPL